MRQIRSLICVLSLFCVTNESPTQQSQPAILHAQDAPPNERRDHPSDPNAKRVPNVTAVTPRESTNLADFPAMVGEILPGFTTNASGVGGIALLNNHFGRDSVLRTHPVSRDQPCTLTAKFHVPKDRYAHLLLECSHHPQGDWELQAIADSKLVWKHSIGPDEDGPKWWTVVVPLSEFSGRDVSIELRNHSTGRSNEFAYWRQPQLITLSDVTLWDVVDPTGRYIFRLHAASQREERNSGELLEAQTNKVIKSGLGLGLSWQRAQHGSRTFSDDGSHILCMESFQEKTRDGLRTNIVGYCVYESATGKYVSGGTAGKFESIRFLRDNKTVKAVSSARPEVDGK